MSSSWNFDDAAVERAARELAKQRKWRWDGLNPTYLPDLLAQARSVLRAASEPDPSSSGPSDNPNGDVS